MAAGKHTVHGQEAKRGRPRTFDVEQVLDAIIEVFWAHGYAGTSYRMLVEATGISQPSLYAAFGDKAALFDKALDRYFACYGRNGLAFLVKEGGDAKSTIAAWLASTAANLTDGSHPTGCLITRTLTECGENGPGAPKAQQCMAMTEAALVTCLKNGIEHRTIPADTDVVSLARTLAAARAGMAVAAGAGTSGEHLADIAVTIADLVPSAAHPNSQKQGPGDH